MCARYYTSCTCPLTFKILSVRTCGVVGATMDGWMDTNEPRELEHLVETSTRFTKQLLSCPQRIFVLFMQIATENDVTSDQMWSSEYSILYAFWWKYRFDVWGLLWLASITHSYMHMIRNQLSVLLTYLNIGKWLDTWPTVAWVRDHRRGPRWVWPESHGLSYCGVCS